MSYQCWSIGYFMGPILGGWAMDQSHPIAHHLWPVVSITTLCGFFILHHLGQRPGSHTSVLVPEYLNIGVKVAKTLLADTRNRIQ